MPLRAYGVSTPFKKGICNLQCPNHAWWFMPSWRWYRVLQWAWGSHQNIPRHTNDVWYFTRPYWCRGVGPYFLVISRGPRSVLGFVLCGGELSVALVYFFELGVWQRFVFLMVHHSSILILTHITIFLSWYITHTDQSIESSSKYTLKDACRSSTPHRRTRGQNPQAQAPRTEPK